MKQILIEQKLLGHQITESEPAIYSTGVYLVPMKVMINNSNKYLWVASEFNDDSYIIGDTVQACSPKIIADKLKMLL